MKRVITLLLLLLFVPVCQAQRESAIWYFGKNAGLDFNSGVPVVIEDGSLSTAEGCATMADENGNLLFYTDGVTVWNRSHLPMPNGSDLKGHSSSTQSGIIIPKPDHPNRYYIFTTYFQLRGGLHFSEVDLDAANGLGDVIQKNIPLRDLVTEKLTAVKHRNGTDFWVLAHDWGSDAYIAYLVTANGISTQPVVSNVGFNLDYPSTGNDVFKSRGYLKTSPDGSKIAACHSFVGLELLDFDTTTGIISNPLVLLQSETKDFYGVEFSTYGDRLYASIINDDIYQFNLRERDIATTKLPLNVPTQMTGALQLALDGKIYVAGAKKLAVIEYPEEHGAACGFRANAIDLGVGESTYGLPPFITSYFDLGIQAEGFCYGDATHFSVTTLEPIDAITWDFGDGHTSTLESPSHLFEAVGTYTVSVTMEIGTRIKTETRQITIYESPTAHDANHAQCDIDETGQYFIDLEEWDEKVLGGQDSQTFEVSYFQNEVDAHQGENEIAKDEYSTTSMIETLHARVEHIDLKDCYAVSQVQIAIVALPKPVLEESYVVCPSNPFLTLNGGAFDSWSWQNAAGEEIGNLPQINLTELGTYSLTVTNLEEGQQCENTIYFDLLPAAVPDDFRTTVNHFAEDLQIQIAIDRPGSFQYSLDGETFQDEPRFKVLPGKYVVFVRGKNGCATISKEVVALGYQKFFTPNGDGINDYWKIEGSTFFPESIVYIFDRYGKLVQQLLPNDQGWDGSYQGLPLPSSDYWFRFENSDGEIFKSHFTLKR